MSAGAFNLKWEPLHADAWSCWFLGLRFIIERWEGPEGDDHWVACGGLDDEPRDEYALINRDGQRPPQSEGPLRVQEFFFDTFADAARGVDTFLQEFTKEVGRSFETPYPTLQ